jgi:23S rRNA pseudouridine1911/1915/1917 synthase
MCNIVYEDNHLLVVIKPPNLLTQADATGDDDLLSRMKRYIKDKYQKPGDVYLGLIHRMDRPVGGLLCLARTSKAAARLSKQVSGHEMAREYLAIVEGKLPPSGTLRHYLIKDEAQNMVSVVPEGTQGSQLAILHFDCLDTLENTSLCHIRLETGRAHQIRVQMASSGHPLVFDARYGHGIPGNQIALWGAKLTLAHPTRGEQMTFFSAPEGEAWAVYQEAIARFLKAESLN